MIADYVDHVRRCCLPFWQVAGFDAERDLFFERLTHAGSPLAVPRRAMVQARQIYVYAHAARLGWHMDGLEKAARAMHRTCALFADAGPRWGFAFSSDPGGRTIVAADRDAYTQAFVLFAAAHLYQATGERGLVATIDSLTLFIETALADRVHGGVVDSLAAPLAGSKRQNPQMHLLEAYLAVEEAMPGRGYLERAWRLVDLFRDRLFDRRHAAVREYFAGDWSRHPDPARADIVEPGHHYEWAWLLEQAERLSGTSLAEERALLLATAMSGGHAASGLIHDEVSGDGSVVTASHRLWPHTEAIKAATTLHRAGAPRARDMADRMGGLLLRRFLHQPLPGGWIDHLHAGLSPRVDYVPASSLYHLFLAAAEADRAFAT